MKRKLRLVLLGFLAAFMFTMVPTIYGEETKGFSYEVIQPENQLDKKVGYLDLLMETGQTQTVVIKLNNSASKEIKVAVSLNGAKTNSNGVIEYGPNEIANDDSLKFPFESIVSAPEEVTIPANSQIDLEVEIKMPATSIDGYISGAIQLQELDQVGNNSGMVINKFAYLVGLLLSEKETEGIKPDLVLNKVSPNLKNYRNAIFVNISNLAPVYLEDMTTDVQIMKKENDEVLYDTKKSGMRMAPNTLIDFAVPMNGEAMVPGDYRANILVTSEAGQRWEWLEEFTITDEEADKYNEQDVSLVQEQGISWQLVLIIVVSFIIVMLLILLVIRLWQKSKKKTAGKKKSSSRKKKR